MFCWVHVGCSLWRDLTVTNVELGAIQNSRKPPVKNDAQCGKVPQKSKYVGQLASYCMVRLHMPQNTFCENFEAKAHHITELAILKLVTL